MIIMNANTVDNVVLDAAGFAVPAAPLMQQAFFITMLVLIAVPYLMLVVRRSVLIIAAAANGSTTDHDTDDITLMEMIFMMPCMFNYTVLSMR